MKNNFTISVNKLSVFFTLKFILFNCLESMETKRITNEQNSKNKITVLSRSVESSYGCHGIRAYVSFNPLCAGPSNDTYNRITLRLQ